MQSHPDSLLTNRERVLFEIARHDRSDSAAMLRAITEGAASALDVDRVGIWRIEGDKMVAADLYHRDVGHRDGDELSLSRYAAYRTALSESRLIVAHDASNDQRTRELSADYLEPHGIGAMLDVPIWYATDPGWVLCAEHVGPARRWTEGEKQFAAHLADLVALTFETAERHAGDRRWRAVSNIVREAVFVIDDEGRVESANRSGQRLLDLAGGGRCLTERRDLVEFSDPTGRPMRGDEPTRYVSGREVSGEIVQATFKRTGERRAFRITSAPMDERRTVVVMADISEEAHMERLKGELLSALAHELNTPLAVVKGYAQHLARIPGIPQSARTMLEAVVRATQRMQRLIGDLVDLSRITLGRITLAREPTDVGELVRGVIRKEGPLADGRVQMEQEDTDLTAYIDPDRVAQAVHAVLDNALRYSPEETSIEVAVKRVTGHVTVSIEDHGGGIPTEQREHIFEPHVRAPAETHGVGLGLFLARAIIERHGGRVECDSRESSGTTFRLNLPVGEPP